MRSGGCAGEEGEVVGGILVVEEEEDVWKRWDRMVREGIAMKGRREALSIEMFDMVWRDAFGDRFFFGDCRGSDGRVEALNCRDGCRNVDFPN